MDHHYPTNGSSTLSYQWIINIILPMDQHYPTNGSLTLSYQWINIILQTDLLQHYHHPINGVPSSSYHYRHPINKESDLGKENKGREKLPVQSVVEPRQFASRSGDNYFGVGGDNSDNHH
ncbi:hypothetical protein KY285_019593 [Solanum tuberosum]|nr:hypothetical protein KY285_019593 [Solanum tuberosum]